MKITRLAIGLFALLLPYTVLAEEISVDSFNCSYLYDYGEVEVEEAGYTSVSVSAKVGLLEIVGIHVYGDSSFEITSIDPEFPDPPYLNTGESLEIQVAFIPESEGVHTAFLVIETDAENSDECIPSLDLDYVEYTLTGRGVDYVQTPAEKMNDIIDFFNDAVEDEEIVGVGATTGAAKAHLRVFDNMLDSALAYIEGGEFEQACTVLEKALLRSDAATPDRPKDFIGGPEAPTLNTMILEVMTALGC